MAKWKFKSRAYGHNAGDVIELPDDQHVSPLYLERVDDNEEVTEAEEKKEAPVVFGYGGK